MDELKEVFFDEYVISIVGNQEKILKRCLELCSKYSVSADDLAGYWLAYAASNSISDLEENKLDTFEKSELMNRKEETDKPSISIADLNMKSSTESKVKIFGQSTLIDLDSDNDDMDNDGTDGILAAYGIKSEKKVTPKVGKEMRQTRRLKVAEADFSPMGYSPAVEAKSVTYGARTKAGDTVLRYKCKDSDYWSEVSGGNGQLNKINPASSTKSLIRSQATFKYMFQRTADMASVLNGIIGDIGIDMLKDDELDIQDLRASSVEECWYLGRIRSEEGRLSQGSTFLEGDLDISGGHIVPLDLSDTEEYRLFPGQVVLIKGKNELGQCLRVSQVATVPPLPLPEVQSKTTRPINVIVASGPFTPVDSLQYEPLSDLLEVLKRDKPDVCILAGPFNDSTNPLIADGGLADTFDEFFEKILAKIKRAISDINTQIVIISSCKDAHHHAVYPSPPYDLERNHEKITVLPDPAMFEVAGITIGFTSMDILKHLANTEISKSTITDRLGGLAKLVLSQRSFYPLYPPDESVPLDVQLWGNHCKFVKSPHILVLPSDLRYFIKEVDGTIVINPERLTKGKSGGTYARFQVKLPDSNDMQTQSVADFCCGEIMKI